MLFNRNFVEVVRAERSAKQNEKGFSLIEAAIVLGMVALVVGGIWVGASSVQNNFRTGKAQEQLLSIAQNVRGWFHGQPSAAGLDLSYAIEWDLIPGDMIAGSDSAITPWSGPVDVSVVSGSSQQFTISFGDIPQKPCAEIAARLTNTADQIGLRSVRVGDNLNSGTAIWELGDTGITPVTAGNACSSAMNAITWTFGVRG